MKSLKEFNEERKKFWDAVADISIKGNDIQCLSCGKEMFDIVEINGKMTEIFAVLGINTPSWPPTVDIVCNNCGYKDIRLM